MCALVGALLLSLPVVAAAQQTQTPEERMAMLLNQARTAQGLNPLAISAELSAAALAHTRDMVTKGYMEHESAKDGATPQQRAIRAGYVVPAKSAWYVIEVITARATPEAALNWLLSDTVHRRVVLRPVMREMGIAYVQGGPWGHLWTIDFGCRPNVLPVIADTSDSGGVTLRLTNEECVPGGGNAEQIGKATQVMVSTRSDFEGAAWQPFVATKTVPSTSSNVFVKLKDAKGREVTSSVATTGATVSASTVTPAAPILVNPSTNALPTTTSTQASPTSDLPTDAPTTSEQQPVVNVGAPSIFDAPAAAPR